MRFVALALIATVGTAHATEPLPSSARAKRGLEIASVTTRDGQGRPELVRDNGNREFRVNYDADGRLQSVNATRGEHISDIVAVNYDESGRLALVRLQGGYQLHFQYLTDGQQIVRDRYGGLIGRTGSLESGYTVVQQSDPTGRIVEALDALDRALSIAAREATDTSRVP